LMVLLLLLLVVVVVVDSESVSPVANIAVPTLLVSSA
jgi:hypothetical protein